MGLLQSEDKGRLLYVLSDGKLREKVEPHTEGATLRVVKDDAGNVKAEKWEVTYPGIRGFITGVTTYDGEYGTNVNVAIKDANDEEFTLSLKANSKYGEDFLHKLPNINRTQEVTIKPYDFEADGRRNTGVSITQGEEKIRNAFNYKNDAGEWESIDGYPQPDAKTKEKGGEKWNIFFAMRRDWVIEYLTAKGLITESAPVGDTSTKDADESF